jgi:hypothetical protein
MKMSLTFLLFGFGSHKFQHTIPYACRRDIDTKRTCVNAVGPRTYSVPHPVTCSTSGDTNRRVRLYNRVLGVQIVLQQSIFLFKYKKRQYYYMVVCFTATFS